MTLQRSMILLFVAVLSAGGGCAALKAKDQPEPTGLAAAPDPTPGMTPAEQSRRFRAVYREGMSLVEQGQYGLALGAFEEAVSAKPQSAEALFNLGACYEAIGDPVAAIRIYRQVLQLTPDDADCFANLGTSFIKMYHREKSPVWRKMARDAWRRSLELKPDQPDVRGFLAKAETLD